MEVDQSNRLAEAMRRGKKLGNDELELLWQVDSGELFRMLNNIMYFRAEDIRDANRDIALAVIQTRNADRLERYTKSLVRLTWGVLALTVGLFALTGYLAYREYVRGGVSNQVAVHAALGTDNAGRGRR